MVIFHSYVSLPEGTTFELVRVHGVPLESNRLEKPCSECPDCHCCWSSLYHIRVCHNTWCINRPFSDIPIYFFKMLGAAWSSLSRDWRTRARKCLRGIVRHQEHQPVGCRNLGPVFYMLKVLFNAFLSITLKQAVWKQALAALAYCNVTGLPFCWNSGRTKSWIAKVQQQMAKNNKRLAFYIALALGQGLSS